MSVREVGRRLRAWEVGRPVARYQTLHQIVVDRDRALIVAFVRMAGESRPWGIVWGHPGGDPRVMSVPDGRLRDDVAALAANFGEDLLAHLRVHNWTYDPLPRDAGPDDLRQVWVPNGQHVAMFHQLAYAYSQTRFGGSDVDTLNALGRLSGWLFRESTRRGCQHLVDASSALREAYAFPAQDARQAHLGFLLAWLNTSGDRAARIASSANAETKPVSPTMDPTMERDFLEKPLERRRSRLREGSLASDEEAEIARILRDELLRRWRLCSDAYDVLASDERKLNVGVDTLVTAAIEEFYWQCQAPELKIADPSQGAAFISHPETDFHGSSAASRYLAFESADERYINALIHDDDELFLEALGDGRALCGQVLTVRDDGQGRTTRPVWTVRLDVDTVQRIREGGRVMPRGSRKHWAVITYLEQGEAAITIELEWNGSKTQALPLGIGAKPADHGWEGQQISLVASDAADLTLRRSQRVWKAKDGPGAWLTHGRPPAPIVADIANDTPEVILDDVTQIEGPTGEHARA
jgi:hypothetical protein